MAARKLQQEIDKIFKKVDEGIQTFESIREKILQAGNTSQKDKLEDALKREIKKLQRHRDQIKTWAAGNDIKDKKPLLEKRKAIEAEMEKFKAIEKEMKTKAFSKEGLSATAKLDPKEKEKLEAVEFLSHMVDELERQIETLEAEEESLQATVKKGKKDIGKADRLSEISRTTERHKFHQGKLELLLRSLQNGNVETEQVHDLEESIRYYVEDNQSVEFMEDDTIYDDLNLDEDEGVFGMTTEADRVSSQDNQSIQDDQAETVEARGPPPATVKPKSTSISETSGPAARRPSNTFKSPLPALATLHTPHAPLPTGNVNNAMKPAPVPARPPGETLKYASAAAAAASSDKGAAIGIAPLPPPPSNNPIAAPPGPSTSPASLSLQRTSSSHSPSASSSIPVINPSATTSGASAAKSSVAGASREESGTSLPAKPPVLTDLRRPSSTQEPQNAQQSSDGPVASQSPPVTKNASPADASSNAAPPSASTYETTPSTGARHTKALENDHQLTAEEEPDSLYHLPPGLQDLVQSFDITKSRAVDSDSVSIQKYLQLSESTRPSFLDAEKPRHYRPDIKYNSPDYYPHSPFASADDPALYGKIDTDTLFYIFYYRQNTFQQFMAARSLKGQSWRFHKQYQTWFQRHEEPKTITEEYEQGTYRFFDYESTWMNRRKAEFRFIYKFLEDDL